MTHHQVVFTIPKMLRIFFKYKKHLLSDLCLCDKEVIVKYLKAVTGRELNPGIIAVIQSFGSRINFTRTCIFWLQREGQIKKTGSIS